MKILIFIKTVFDARIRLECNENTGSLKPDWNIPVLNPDDEAAIAAALKIKKEYPETRVTIIHLGPASGERFIKEAISLGCDDGVRIWDDDLAELQTAAKALIFDRVARILKYNLIFTGTKSLDTATAQLGIMLAASLEVPCITRTLIIDAIKADVIAVTRNLGHGYKEKVESLIPLVVAFEADEPAISHASFDAITETSDCTVPCLDLAQIGISRQAIQRAESHLVFGPLRFPAPGLQFTPAPDASLPAFERRLQLAESLAARRERRIVTGAEDTIVEELFQVLHKQGWLDHLRTQE